MSSKSAESTTTTSTTTSTTTEFVRVKLMQVDFGSQSPARDPYCAVSIKEAVADPGKYIYIYLLASMLHMSAHKFNN